MNLKYFAWIAEIIDKRENIKFALNQVLVNENELISKADEVAFFPPMTGG